MKVDWSIKISDLLTLLAILISATTLSISWSNDRLTREREQADRVRSAAAKALTKLDRWQILQLSIFREMQPVFVETSEMLVEDYNVTKARDYLWKTVNIKRMHIASKVLEEQIETSYLDLLPYFPSARIIFLNVFINLKKVETKTLDDLLIETQQDILSLSEHKNEYKTSILGNALRTTALKHERQLEIETNQLIQPIREFLFEIIGKTDKEILRVPRSYGLPKSNLPQ